MTTLREALAIGPREVVAFVGAGGKTTAMFRLARELRAHGAAVVVTTTTRILLPPPEPGLETVVEDDGARLLAAVAEVLERGHLPVAGRGLTTEGKLVGVSPDGAGALAALAHVTHVLVEADGAARRPFTAPREDEPAIPPDATLVVPVVGADALGRAVEDVAHRPERVMALTGLARRDALDARAIARVLLGPDGSTRGAPAGARVVPCVNKADTEEALSAAREIAGALRSHGARRTVIATLARARAVVEVVEA